MVEIAKDMASSTEIEKEVLTKFLIWSETLGPEEQMILMAVLTRTILRSIR